MVAASPACVVKDAVKRRERSGDRLCGELLLTQFLEERGYVVGGDSAHFLVSELRQEVVVELILMCLECSLATFAGGDFRLEAFKPNVGNHA
jgi:hypothetical protein